MDFKKIILAVLIFGFSISSALAVSGLDFTSEPQTLAVGSISDGLTVSTGEAIGETSDLFLTSSSATGEFSSSATNWQTVTKVTWNSNWSNRTFYYRDSMAGTDTINVTLTTRAGGQSWSASQTITVGDGGGAGVAGDNSGSGDNETTISSGATSATQNKSSANSTGAIKVSIGDKRTVTVNAPVNFKVKTTGIKKGDNVEHNWSFGDGATAMGVRVAHVYEYPGIYTVVLNTRRDIDDEEATAKTEVEVVAPDVVISDVANDGAYIKLTNNSAKVINLGFWQLVSGNKNFILPRDTMIAPKATLYLSRSVTGLLVWDGLPVQLLYPTGKLSTTHEVTNVSSSDNQAPHLVQTLERLTANMKPKPARTIVTKKVSVPEKVEPVSRTITLGEIAPKPWWQRIFSH